MAAVDLPLPGVAGRPGTGPGPGVITVGVGGGCSLRVFDAGLACCGVEVAAALRRSGALAAVTAGQQLNVFVVAGTVTDKLAPYVPGCPPRPEALLAGLALVLRAGE